jgi:hypothetical protein
MSDITLYIEAHSNIPYITTDSAELINILRLTLDDNWMDCLTFFKYPNIIAVTYSDIRRIKESVELVALTLDIFEIECVDGSWKKGVDFFLSGKTYVGRKIDYVGEA